MKRKKKNYKGISINSITFDLHKGQLVEISENFSLHFLHIQQCLHGNATTVAGSEQQIKQKSFGLELSLSFL